MAHEVVAIIPAAGGGTRMGADRPKQYLGLGGMPILTRTLLAAQAAPCVDAMVVVAPPGDVERLRECCLAGRDWPKLLAVVAGGARRQDSVSAGLAAARAAGAQWVLIHDGVRCLVDPGLFAAVLDGAAASGAASGAAIAAVPAVDTIKVADGAGWVDSTPDRSRLWQIQTPQGFAVDLLTRAFAQAEAQGWEVTDEAALIERLGHKVRLVMGARENLKITTPEDLRLARGILGEPATRTGLGYDVHRLVPGRRLILGGVDIPHETGLLGHSDADVLTHAVMDALLAAAGLGDIGRHFPDTDPAYAGADSLALLARVVELLAAQGWRPAQVTVTLMAQRPKIAPHVPAMVANLARALGLAPERLNLAATTTEGLGPVGRQEGMAAQALAVITPLA